MLITQKDIEMLALGAAFLGTGGGGDPYIGKLIAINACNEFGPVKVIDIEEFDEDGTAYVVGAVGAPTVMVEKGISISAAEIALTKLEEHTGKPATAVIPAEIGGLNSTVPVMLAARRGIPILNADGMGRAFPELQMITYSIYGTPVSPLVIANEHNEFVLVNASTDKRSEGMVRSLAIEMGLNPILCGYTMSKSDLMKKSIPRTLTLAIGLGKAIEKGRNEGDPVEYLIQYLQGTEYYKYCVELFDGKIIDLDRETTKGFSIGRCHLQSITNEDDHMEIEFKNENLVARLNGMVKTIVPDLICIIDRETAEPIPCEALRYGQRVKVIGISAPPMLRTERALLVVGPQAFGLKEPFQPIERLYSLD